MTPAERKERKSCADAAMDAALRRRSQELVIRLIFGHGVAGRVITIEGDDVYLTLPSAPHAPLHVGTFSQYFGLRS